MQVALGRPLGVYLVNQAIFGSKIGLWAHFNSKIKGLRALLGNFNQYIFAS